MTQSLLIAGERFRSDEEFKSVSCVWDIRYQFTDELRDAVDERLLIQARGLVIEDPDGECIGPVRLDLQDVVVDRRYLFSSTKSWKCFKRSERLAGDWRFFCVSRYACR